MKFNKIIFFVISIFIIFSSVVSKANADRLKDLVSFSV